MHFIPVSAWLSVSSGGQPSACGQLAIALIIFAFCEIVQVVEINVVLPGVKVRAVELNLLFVSVGMFVAARFIGLLGTIITAPALASGI